MTVYVLIETHFYPEIDGPSEIIGVYSTMELAEKDAEKFRLQIEDEEDAYGEPAMEIMIDEFTLQEGSN